MNRIGMFWKAFTRALAEASGNPRMDMSTVSIRVEMDVNDAELKVAGLQAKINETRRQVAQLADDVDRIAWVHPGDKYQA